MLRDDWRNVLRAFCLRIAETAGYAVSVTFMLSYLSEREAGRPPHHPDRPDDRGRPRASSPRSCWGALTDRIGRRPVYLLGTALTVALGCPAVPDGQHRCRDWRSSSPSSSATPICQNSLAGVQGAWFSELFAAKTRTTGASLAYQLSAVVSGFTPLVATALYAGTGWIGPALLFSGYGLLGLHRRPGDPRDLGTGPSGSDVALLERALMRERETGQSVVPEGASWPHRWKPKPAERGRGRTS